MKPNKLICMNKTAFYFGCVIAVLIIYLTYDKFITHPSKEDCKCECPTFKEKDDKKDIVIVDRPTHVIDRVGDTQQFKQGPERYYRGRDRGLPINIRTRGDPNEYQNIGTLTYKNDVRPLYGRRIYRGANMWNYYTLLNNHIQVKIPIEKDSDNCISERGCPEIMDGSTVKINGKVYKIDLYPYSDFRYIPY